MNKINNISITLKLFIKSNKRKPLNKSMMNKISITSNKNETLK